ncbi:isoprenoid synthase domain-containing protein [Hygrophoropsis aurantiaca]|uniref:Isoprenoid synthase domain-containing protein n=1 Tax=Hygrophoropsis aurantiaca TaxID=72124 RepID=A0ACB8AEN6_9AGAM|nr:isoprenoid synthase domain-containing protein [Hygrophoropsis aurantiaca]
MPSTPVGYTLPDLLSVCPFQLGDANPYYKEAGADSKAWLSQYHIFTDRKRAFFVQGCNELLCSRVYPYAGYTEFRTTCDFVNLLFVIDELSDDMNGEDARDTCDTFYRTMVDPEYNYDSPIVQMTKDFRERLTSTLKPRSFQRFLGHCKAYVDAVSEEAELREAGEVLDLASFIALRRENSAIRPCFGLIEYILGIELPDNVLHDPTFQSIYWAGADMVCWSNDVYSFNMEQAKGHTGNNVVTVLMREHGIELQEAADMVGGIFEELMRRYLEDRTRLPSWGPEVDADVARYIQGIDHWVVGNLQWSFETPRYFGSRHTDVLRTLRITLIQEQDSEEDD